MLWSGPSILAFSHSLGRVRPVMLGHRTAASSLLLPISAGTNQSSEYDRSTARVARIQSGQERSLRKTSRAVAGFLTSVVAAIRFDT